jgi:FkbM family methyltransferase
VRSNQGADSFIMSEVFREKCYFISLNENITNILDLGSNAGFTAVYFSRLFKNATIACVEPMPGNISILKANLLLNSVNSFVFEAAAAVENGKITMETGDKDYGGKVHHIPFGKTMNNGTVTVEGLTVSRMIEKLNWNKIDLLKVDIEGYEGILFTQNNDWLKKVEVIIMEIHEGVAIQLIEDAIAPYGFTNSKQKKGNWIFSKNEIC